MRMVIGFSVCYTTLRLSTSYGGMRGAGGGLDRTGLGRFAFGKAVRAGTWTTDRPASRGTRAWSGRSVDVLADLLPNTSKKANRRTHSDCWSILHVRKRLALMGRNPATGKAIKIKASKKVAFRAAKELKLAV